MAVRKGESMEATTRTGERQAKLWGRRPGDWAEIQEPLVRPLYDAVLEALGVGIGTQHLDAGCGAGLAAQMAAVRGATVSGLDATPELLEIARDRVPDGEFHQGDLEELPYESDRFDTVAGFNSFQFAGDPANALREAARVAKPGAPIAVATWGQPDQSDMAAILSAFRSMTPPPAPGAVGPFALSEPGKLEGFVRAAGLEPDAVAEVETVWEYPDLDTALRGMSSVGAAAMAIATVGEDRVRQTVAAALARFEFPGGSYTLRNVFRYLIARNA
jgi:SAM-dependent methyltransferase